MRCSRGILVSLTVLVYVASSGRAARAELFSYATQVGATSSAPGGDLTVALGPPDYAYTTGVLTAGVSAVFIFPAPIDDIVEEDLLLYIHVLGTGTTSSMVRVEARAEPNDAFVEVTTFGTGDARILRPTTGLDHMHTFAVDFAGLVDKVTEVRITNVEGDDLNLDALEAIHPALASPHQVVEMRIFRLRDDDTKRFALRFKNLGRLLIGEPMTGFAVAHSLDDVIDQTDQPVVGTDGEFAATPETTAGPDNGDTTRRTEYVWSVEGEGLDPGEFAAHISTFTVDTDTLGDEYLENMLFTVTFQDGTALTANFDDLTADGVAGQLYALYQTPPFPVSINGPRPAIFYEFSPVPVVAEDPCLDCAEDMEPPPDNTNGNGNDNGNDNTDGGPVGTPAPCAPALIGPMVFALFSLAGLRVTRRRR